MTGCIKIIPIAFLLVGSAFSVSYSAVLLDRVVATVNEEVVTWSELMGLIAFEEKSVSSGSTGVEKSREMERQFLDSMIDMKLQLQEAARMGLGVGEQEINGAVEEIKRKYNLTDETLAASLGAEGMTIEDYRSRLSEQVLIQKVVNFAVRSNIVVTDREIEEYYEANRERFDEKEKLRIRQIFFADPGNEALRKETEANAENVLERIAKGEDFARLAVELSEGPGAQSGGDLGYIKRGSAIKEIEEVAFSMKTGEVSRPFWSTSGLHIIKLENRITGGDLEKVRDRIKEVLFKRAFETKYSEWKTGLREKAHIEIKL